MPSAHSVFERHGQKTCGYRRSAGATGAAIYCWMNLTAGPDPAGRTQMLAITSGLAQGNWRHYLQP